MYGLNLTRAIGVLNSFSMVLCFIAFDISLILSIRPKINGYLLFTIMNSIACAVTMGAVLVMFAWIPWLKSTVEYGHAAGQPAGTATIGAGAYTITVALVFQLVVCTLNFIIYCSGRKQRQSEHKRIEQGLELVDTAVEIDSDGNKFLIGDEKGEVLKSKLESEGRKGS
ncbi:hypothetical protein F5B20DRAFT_468259 [Whalleya microplaca]|nr:hypothetical protein F5B20DRAFT_468259 [Whalleya microplaca]